MQETTEGNSSSQEETKKQETEEVKENTSYHWVNPEYQKRQEGAADAGQNSYETDAYRERIGYTNTQNTGYEGNQNNRNAGMETPPAAADIWEAATMSLKILSALLPRQAKDIMAPISLLRNLPEKNRKRKNLWAWENAFL